MTRLLEEAGEREPTGFGTESFGFANEPAGFAIDAIVLAAGFGSRMGRIKPLVPVHGTPSLVWVLKRLSEAGLQNPIVVLGYGADEIARAVDLSQAQTVVNDHPARGMASSLALGLGAVSAHAAGALTLHADMPFVAPSTIRAVAEAAAGGARIAAPCLGGTRGFPVYFARSCFPGLINTLHGEIGGREYIEAHKQDLVTIAVEDEGIIRDMDLPEDIPVPTEQTAPRS